MGWHAIPAAIAPTNATSPTHDDSHTFTHLTRHATHTAWPVVHSASVAPSLAPVESSLGNLRSLASPFIGAFGGLLYFVSMVLLRYEKEIRYAIRVQALPWWREAGSADTNHTC